MQIKRQMYRMLAILCASSPIFELSRSLPSQTSLSLPHLSLIASSPSPYPPLSFFSNATRHHLTTFIQSLITDPPFFFLILIDMLRTLGINLLRRTARRPVYRLIGPSLARHSSSGGEGKSGNVKAKVTKSHAEAMRLANVEALREKLRKEGKEVIPYDELVKICRTAGVVTTTDEAAAFARVLDDAGVVLLFRDRVYLYPDKVVDLVRKAVPLALLQEEEASWKAELQKLQEKKEEIDMAAHKQVRRILWAGLGLTVVQAGLFFRLTFWEFSWDVMEPIAFFTTSAGIVVGYAYFMFTSRDPSYQDLLMRLFLARQRKLIKRHNFDVARFIELQKHSRIPQYTCASVKRQIGLDIDPHDLLQDHSNQN